MARAIDTNNPLYSNIKLLVAVDDDFSTVREFVTNDVITLDSSVVVEHGSRGYGVKTFTSSTTLTNSFNLTTPVPMVHTGTWMFIFNNLSKVGKNARFVDYVTVDDAHPMIHGDGVTENVVKFYDGHFTPRGVGKTLLIDGSWFLISASFVNNNTLGGNLRYNSDRVGTEMAVSDWSSYTHSIIKPFHATQGHVAGNLFAWVLFDKALSPTEVSGVYNSLTGNGRISLLTGGGVTQRKIFVSLVDPSGASQPNLSDIKWAFFDQTTPDALVAPVDQGVGEVTDGSGVLELDVPNTTKNDGEVGFLVLSNTDGSPNQLPSASSFAGPVTVSVTTE